MLSELHCAVACISFEVYLVVAVVTECCPEVADSGSSIDGSLGNGCKPFAVGIVATAAWHEVVDNSLKAFVGEDKVLPCLKVELGSVHVNVKSARVVYLYIAEVEYPAYLFKFLKSLLTVKDWAYQLKVLLP